MKQKTLHIDFNDSTLGTIAREGEHNRTQLVFVLDEILMMMYQKLQILLELVDN